jgi:hypothetical protein
VEYLSEETKENLRIIDVIYINENNEYYLYTIDIYLPSLIIEDKKENIKTEFNDEVMEMIKKYKKRIEKLQKYESIMHENLQLWKNFIERDNDFQIMRKIYTQEFYDFYYKGLDEFLNGNWENARFYFIEAEKELGIIDGPIQHKLNIMKKYEFKKPIDWKNNEFIIYGK